MRKGRFPFGPWLDFQKYQEDWSYMKDMEPEDSPPLLGVLTFPHRKNESLLLKLEKSRAGERKRTAPSPSWCGSVG